eukprot:6194444-Pleurochrysis_carterae.AAC.2
MSMKGRFFRVVGGLRSAVPDPVAPLSFDLDAALCSKASSRVASRSGAQVQRRAAPVGAAAESGA